VSEADVYSFAGISGDMHFAHLNAEKMSKSTYGQRIAHGALIVGLMSAAASTLIAKLTAAGDDAIAVSLGYDRIRFVASVFFGDTVTVTYGVREIDTVRLRSLATIEAKNQRGETIAVADHVMKWLAP
jgi:acyl dehydratase